MSRPRDQRARLQAVPRRAQDVEPEFTIEGRPLIEPGEYLALGGDCRVQTHPMFDDQSKAVLDMIVRVPDQDAEFGCREETLQRFWNASRVSGRWHFRKSSALAKEWVIATGRRLARHERSSPRVFKGVLFKVKVKTVWKNYKHQPLPEHARYSVIEEILERVAGGASL